MGHTYKCELTFSYEEIQEIGYAIDFKEIKRVGCQWIDDKLDHGIILNPKDDLLIQTSQALGSKIWLMSLNGENEYCNPTAENISKEIFLAMELLFKKVKGLDVYSIRLWETPNCFVDTTSDSFKSLERINWLRVNHSSVSKYAEEKGQIEYDDRKII